MKFRVSFLNVTAFDDMIGCSLLWLWLGVVARPSRDIAHRACGETVNGMEVDILTGRWRRLKVNPSE